ncbi:hypothetical protein jhhlp_000745 [Lomentospora prolificans]|uniref:Cupin type-2 domain-containing protein n=1 Tax=Lomentospora prolificans TaxID=41688 RepID=A0A2N3NJB5_9PEZI|nr:hypothetical protein jhhlp_000745 [Lomentospora prolificans]
MACQGKLSHPKRFITTTDDNGKAILDRSIPAEAPFYVLSDGEVNFAQCYVTSGFPTQLNDGADLKVYSDYLKSPPGLTVSNGTVLRYVDMPPSSTCAMHITTSLDYGVVLEGEVDLLLDSGEEQRMKRGDICIQRATMHAWRNNSETEWARMLYILQPVQPLIQNGKEVKENLGTMEGVRSST